MNETGLATEAAKPPTAVASQGARSGRAVSGTMVQLGGYCQYQAFSLINLDFLRASLPVLYQDFVFWEGDWTNSAHPKAKLKRQRRKQIIQSTKREFWAGSKHLNNLPRGVRIDTLSFFPGLPKNKDVALELNDREVLFQARS